MMIHKELCKRSKFDHATKWYMHKPKSVLENEAHKILCDFETQMNHPIPVRRPDLVLINKKKKRCCLVDFAVAVDNRTKIKESAKIYKRLDLAREIKNAMEYEDDRDTNCNLCARNSPQRLVKKTGGIGNKEKNQNPPDNSILREDSEESYRSEETCCHSDSSEGSLANTGAKNSQEVIIIIPRPC